MEQPKRKRRPTIPLHIEPRPSLLLGVIVVAAHSGAAAVVLFVPLPLWLKLGLLCAVAASLTWSIRQHVLLHSRAAIRRLVCTEDGEWRLYRADGQGLSGRLLSSSSVQPALVILNFAVGRVRRRSVVLAPDSIAPDSLRQLRARLRLQRPQSDAV